MYFALSPKYSLFACRLNGSRAQHSHHFRCLRGLCALVPPEAHSGPDGFPAKKPPEVGRRCTGRRTTATSRLRSCCWAKAPRWTPRKTTAGASKAGRPQTSRSRRLGHFRRLFRDWNLCIFTKCLAKLWVFHTKKCETCREQWSQCNMPIINGLML